MYIVFGPMFGLAMMTASCGRPRNERAADGSAGSNSAGFGGQNDAERAKRRGRRRT